MYPTSTEYKKAISAKFREGHKIKIQMGETCLSDEYIEEVSFSHIANDDEYFKLGSVASKKIEVTLKDVDDELKKKSFNAQDLKVTYEFSNQEVPIGIFKVDGKPSIGEDKKIKLTLYDRLYYTDKRYYCMLGESYTGKDLLEDVLAQQSLELASKEILGYINMDIKQTYVPGNMTCRQIISFCAELCGCNAIMTRDDKLNFISITNNMAIDESLDIANCYDMSYDERDFILDGIRYYESDDSFLKAGAGKDRILCLEPTNFLINQKVVNNLFEKLEGLSFRSFKTSHFTGDPSIDVFDVLEISSLDKKQVYKIMPTVVTWSFEGGLKGSLENNASTSETVEPKNTTSLEQKINNTYYEKAGVTYAYNNEKIILGLRDSTLCDIKFANSYGNVPAGAIGISGFYTPSEDSEVADISMHFISDDKELPFAPVQRITTPGKHVIYAPLVLYMLASGDHYFKAYASISNGSFAIEPEQFNLHLLTIGTGGGMKSPDTYLSTIFDSIELNSISNGFISIDDIQTDLSTNILNPSSNNTNALISVEMLPTNAEIEINEIITFVNNKQVVYADTIFFNKPEEGRFMFDDRFVTLGSHLSLNTVYQNIEYVTKEIDGGNLIEIQLEVNEFKQVETWEVTVSG